MVTFSKAFESPCGTTFDDGKHTMGAIINTTPEVVKDTKPAMAIPINTTSAPLDTKNPAATLFLSRWRRILALPTHMSREEDAQEAQDPGQRERGVQRCAHAPRRDFYQGRVQREEDHPTWNPDRKEKKALPAGANTALGKGKAVAVKEERDNEDDDDHVIAVFGPENPTFSGSDTIILTASLKFEMWLDDKPVPPPGRTQVTAPFDIDNTTNRGSKPSKTVYYHD
ncbi:hypothetical protein LTR56_018863 [Elasticomyces elasticus]|nr:hypothetical protein LTR56_018863 [Elasticomyces elasticus]KAK3638006.1 hypothetical protein LTR22_017968 [Elasticomyces elasticus]KAK4912956.1 hypothetical protein LTR49_018706 [Elasticomyces elasticus]KAK5749844.1 hypothetical protein LTS12_020062 [Elasticomyces elasticus]